MFRASVRPDEPAAAARTCAIDAATRPSASVSRRKSATAPDSNPAAPAAIPSGTNHNQDITTILSLRFGGATWIACSLRQDGRVESSQPAVDLPLGFAHRGARSECPDNTLASFARALELGAPGLESDAWVTADGVVVLDHDGVLHGWRRRSIARVPAERLPPHVPRLADLYAASGTAFQLSLDVKDPSVAPAVVAVAEEHDAAERLWICTDHVALLHSWRDRWPRVHLVASARHDLSRRWPASTLAAGGIDAVNLREREWHQKLVDEVHDAGLLAFGWGAQTPRQLDRLLDLGLDGVYSDYVARMVRSLLRHATAG